MGNIVDERIVQMKFDNSNFERNVKATMNSLSSLKQRLDMSKSAESFNILQKAANKVDFSKLESAAHKAGFHISDIFAKVSDVLEYKIAGKLVSSFENLVKSMSVDQITAGMSKFEDKTTAVQTIMSATASTWEESAKEMGFAGTQMEFVSDQLQKLNWYSDETSYSFTDMTSNIGKFTSSGVKLEDAVEAMEGISSWAALSGQNTQSASRAMYNLAQAMSVGAVKLMDWKSIENANMATVEFKQAAIDAAVEVGNLTKVGEGLWKTLDGNEVSVTNFNQALSDGWFTSKVLMDTLSEYGKASVYLSKVCDEYGVTASQFLTGMDQYNKGTKTLDDIATNLGISTEKLLPMFEDLGSEEYKLGLKAFRAAQEAKTFTEAIEATKDAVSTGWMTTFETIFGNYEEAKVLWTDLANRLWDVFAASGETRNQILALWKANEGRKVLINAFWNVWDAISNVTDILKDAFKEIFPSLSMSVEDVAKKLGKMTYSLMTFTKKFKEFFKVGDELTENGERLKRIFKGVAAVFDIFKQVLIGVANGFKTMFNKLNGDNNGILEFFAKLGDKLVQLDEWFKSGDKFTSFFSKVGSIGAGVIKVLVGIINGFKNFFTIISNFKPIQFIINGFEQIKNRILGVNKGFHSAVGLFGQLIEKIKSTKIYQVISSIVSAIGDFLIPKLQKAFGIAKDFLGSIGKMLTKFFNKLNVDISNANLDSLFDIINHLLTAGLLTAITKFVKGLGQLPKSAESTITSFKDIFTGFKSISGHINGVLDQVKSNLANMQKAVNAKAIKEIAISIAILAASLLVLSMIPPAKLTSSMFAITGLFADLMGSFAAYTKIMGGTKKLKNAALIMIGISASVLILSFALKTVAKLNLKQVGTGILALTATMAILLGAVTFMTKMKTKAIKGAAGMILLAIAVRILAGAVAKLGQLEWGEIQKGLVALSGIMIILAIFTKIASGAKKMISIGTGLLILSVALLIFVSVIKKLNAMSGMDILKGEGALGGLLLMIALFTKLAGGTKKMISLGIGILLISVALGKFVTAAQSFAGFSWEELAKAGAALGGLFLILGVFSSLMKGGKILLIGVALGVIGNALAKFVPSLQAFGSMDWGQLARAGVAMLGLFLIIGMMTVAFSASELIGFGIGLGIFGGGLVKMAKAMEKFGNLSWKQLGMALVSMAAGMALFLLAGAAAYALAPGLLVFAASILAVSVAIALASASFTLIAISLATMSAAIVTLAAVSRPAMMTVCANIKMLIEFFVKMIPTIAAGIVEGIATIWKSLAENIPTIVSSMVTIFKAILEALVEVFPLIGDFLFKILGYLIEKLVEYTPIIVEAGWQMLLSFINGIKEHLPEIIQTGADIIVSFIEGITNAQLTIIDAAWNCIITFINGITESINTYFPQLCDAFKNLFIAIFNAILTLIKTNFSIVTAFVTLIKDCVAAIKKKASDFVEAGKNLISGIIKGIAAKAGEAFEAVKNFGQNLLSNLMNALKEHSPSRATTEMGEYLDQGLINGLMNLKNRTVSTARSLGEEVINTLDGGLSSISDIASNMINMDPVIRPTLDLSKLASGARSISSMFGNQSVSVGASGKNQNGGSNVDGNGLTFIQNNYSPKALNRIDIYRQTENQFSRLKGVISV